MSYHRFRYICLLILAISASQTALYQQDVSAQDLQNLLPTHGRLSYVSVEGARTLSQGEWNLSVYAHYGRDPLLLIRNGQVSEVLVRYITTAELIAAFSLHDRVELGIALPYSFTSGVSSRFPVDDAQGLGDIRLNPKFIFVKPKDSQGFGLGVNTQFILPTGNFDRDDEDQLFVRRNFSSQLNLFAEYLFKEFRAALNAGYRVRPTRGIFDVLTDLDLSSGPTWGLGLGYSGISGLEITTEIFQRFMTFQRSPLEGLIALKTTTEGSLNPIIAVGAGMGGDYSSVSMRIFGGLTWTPRESGGGISLVDTDKDGIIDLMDRCPKSPEDFDGLQDHDGCPEDDVDRDGIKDEVDQCPEQKEDLDQFEDQDGCPEIDNDRDGIMDQLDRCPNDPETLNQYLDQDGCPDQVTEPAPQEGELIGLSEKIFFEHNESIIMKRSYPILSQVATLMKQHPQIGLVRIEGHTDDTGSPQFNLNLSIARAEAVKLHLVGLGIGVERLEAVGYGDQRAIASNDTEEGRALNRRVDFRIIRGPQEIFKVDRTPPPVPKSPQSSISPQVEEKLTTSSKTEVEQGTQPKPAVTAPQPIKAESSPDDTPSQDSDSRDEESTSTRPYAIQVKASYRLKDAEKVRDLLIKDRFPAYILSVEQDSGQVVHRVRIGPYVDRSAAKNGQEAYEERYPDEKGFYLVKISSSEARKYR